MKAKFKIFLIFCKVWIARIFSLKFKVSFTNIKGSWYCDIPGWPKEYFPNTLMVSQADLLLDKLSKGKSNRVFLDVYISCHKKDLKDYMVLTKKYSSIHGGAYFTLSNSNLPEHLFTNIWLCPVTLFVLGSYPEYIYFKIRK